MKNLLVFLFGMYGLYLYGIHRLTFYINTFYIPFFVIASSICVVIGLFGLFLNVTTKRKKVKLIRPSIKSILFYLPLITLLSLGFLVKPKSLSFSYSKTQPTKTLYKDFTIRDTYQFPPKKIEYAFKDWYFDIKTSPDPRKIAGQPVKIIGFVYKQPEFNHDVFLLSRYVVTCCAVDATPTGFPVKSTDAVAYEDGTWVEVTGEWTILKDRNNDERLFIIPSTISKAKEPDEPYVMSIDFYYWL